VASLVRGGSVYLASAQAGWHALAAGEARFEDGTVGFGQIPDLEAGLSWVGGIGIEVIHRRVMRLTGWLIDRLAALRHGNGAPMARILGPASTRDRGGTIAFNLLDPGGRVVDERAVTRDTAMAGISIRTGCHCNPGASEDASSSRGKPGTQGRGHAPRRWINTSTCLAQRRGAARIGGPGLQRRVLGAVRVIRGDDRPRSRSRHRRPGAPAGMLSHHGSEEVMVENGPSSARRLLGVFAHPDDEVFCAAGTMARAGEAGAEVMIVSATRGEQGQIRDPTAATRRTLGAVREGELGEAAAELGVQRVQVLAYPDGTLQQHRSSLGAAIAEIMRRFDPDTVITFGADGGYGHPDHVAISELTTEASRVLARDHNVTQRLYHAVFPSRRTSMAEELAHWIAGSGRRATDRAALQAIALFAGEAATMHAESTANTAHALSSDPPAPSR
jgi:LmbE family N-acetylglucosaminyl deacetylase